MKLRFRLGQNITSDGRPHLGVPLGTQEYTEEFIAKKVEQLCTELRSLSNIAESQPHSAYAALTHGLSSRWSYLSRTTPHISRHLEKLESTLRLELIPRFTGRPPLAILNVSSLLYPQDWAAWASGIQLNQQTRIFNHQEWSQIL